MAVKLQPPRPGYQLCGETGSRLPCTSSRCGGGSPPNFYMIVFFINKVDYPDTPNPHPIDVIIQPLTTMGSGVISEGLEPGHNKLVVCFPQSVQLLLHPFAAESNLEHGPLAGTHNLSD